MRATGIEVVFIDLDNTITDTDGNSYHAMQCTYDELQIDNLFPSFSIFWDIYFEINQQLWELYREQKITREQLNIKRFDLPLKKMRIESTELSLKMNETFYKYFLPMKTVCPHAYETLDYLKSKYRLAIVSNGTKASQIEKIKTFQLREYFEKIILSDDIGFPKPNTIIYNAALKEMKCDKKQAIMVGDDFIPDIYGAHQAGIEQIWYNPKHKSADKNGIKPLAEIEDLLQLTEIL